jgi:hypothetical protein
LSTHIPTVLRLSLESPYSDIKNAFKQFLNTLANYDSSFGNLFPSFIGPSYYVSIDKVPPIISTTELSEGASEFQQTQAQLMEDIFLAMGRVSHIDQLMIWHPKFASLYAQATQFIMDDDGKLILCILIMVLINGLFQ